MTLQTFCKLLMSCLMVLPLSFAALAEEDPEREGGMTGTGILGEITELGSIIVNGQRILFAPEQTVTNALGPRRADALLPGDVVAVAVTPGEQDWTADAISQVHALVGPVSALGDDTFTVLDVEVSWPGPAPVPGEWVAVSGFWVRGAVTATRLEPLGPRETFSIQGSYRVNPSRPVSMVGSVTLDLEPLQHAVEGDVIRVEGTLNAGGLQVTDVYLGLFDRPVSLVLAEGYLTDVAPSGHYTVAGSGLSAYTDNRRSVMSSDRVSVCGIDGQLGATTTRKLQDLVDRLGCPDPSN